MITTRRTTGAAILSLVLLLPLPGLASEEDDDLTGLGPAAISTATAGLAFGDVLSDGELAAQRGGDVHINQNNATATVEDNVAQNVTTGNNTVSGNAFSNVNRVPMVVQYSGNNVVIQNSTILNLQLQ